MDRLVQAPADLDTPEAVRQLFADFDATFGERGLAQLMGWDVAVRVAVILKRFCFWCSEPPGAERVLGATWVDGHRWVPQSRRAAAERFGLTEDQARRSLEWLVENGWLLMERRRFRGHGTCWYRPNPVMLAALLGQDRAADARHLPSTCPADAQLDQSTPCTPSLPNSKTTTGSDSLRSSATTGVPPNFSSAASVAENAAGTYGPDASLGSDHDQLRGDRHPSSRPAADAHDVTDEEPPQQAARPLRSGGGHDQRQPPPIPARYSTTADRHAHVDARFPIVQARFGCTCPRCGTGVLAGDPIGRGAPGEEYERRWLCASCAAHDHLAA